MKRFLLCGLGSIGQRHARILRRLLGDHAELHAYRSRGLQIVINDNMTAQEGESPEAAYGITPHTSLADALALRPDAVFITNPISEHVRIALEAARAGCAVFIEKPVGDSLEGVPELQATISGKKLATCTGYQLRFHPAVMKIKKWLAEGAVGRVIHAQLHFGEWLPGMHPYEDYRISHAAQAQQGGGVILCLSHEIDYACWLFGQPRSVMASGGISGELEVDVEDTADLLFQCGEAGREHPVHVHLDFLQRPARRNCLIVGTHGVIEWSYYALEATLNCSGKVETHAFPDFVRNDLFLAQTKNFLAALDGEERPRCTLDHGVATLKACLAAKESLRTGRVVQIDA